MKKYIQPLIISILVMICIDKCNNSKNLALKHEQNLKALADTTSYYKNKLGQEVATKLSLQLTENQLKEQLKTKNDENTRLNEALKKIKKPIVVVQSDQSVKIDTIYIPFKNDSICQFSFDTKVKDEWFSFTANGNQKGIKISDFELRNNQTLVFGWKKKNIFSNPELRAEIANTNPYFKQKNIKPVYIVYKRSWYEKPVYTVPLGFVLGMAASSF